MTVLSIDALWARIAAHEGETFQQIRGRQFTYEVHGGYLRPSTTNQNIPRSHFEESLALVPLQNPCPSSTCAARPTSMPS
jgi:hypothetical protein